MQLTSYKIRYERVNDFRMPDSFFPAQPAQPAQLAHRRKNVENAFFPHRLLMKNAFFHQKAIGKTMGYRTIQTQYG